MVCKSQRLQKAYRKQYCIGKIRMKKLKLSSQGSPRRLKKVTNCEAYQAHIRSILGCQLKRQDDPPRYVYTELAFKNRAGGLAQLRVKNKSVEKYAVSEAGDWRLVPCSYS